MFSKDTAPAPQPTVPAGAELATLATGCFWCTEAALEQIDGVLSVTSGYMGGKGDNPSYEAVCGGDTGHAECVQVVYQPKTVSYDALLKMFWKIHDPTTLNRQGGDTGTQYRSAIFYHTDAQKATAEASKKAADKYERPIVTEITKAVTFWPAEKYHQDYFKNNPNAGYCVAVIKPKLAKAGLSSQPTDKKVKP